MKKIGFLFLLLSLAFHAQNNRFMYDYKFAKDINKKDTLKSELMYLDVTKEGSTFYSHEKMVQDSTMKAEIQKQITMGSGNINVKKSFNNRSSVNFSVDKVYPNFETKLHTSIGNNRFILNSTPEMQWKILPEKEKIGEYNVQKATTDFGGRIWFAWFTTEIPIQDGPYKFSGLPGLILKMEDQTKTHIFTFVGSKKLQTQKSDEKTDDEISAGPGSGIVMIGGSGGKELPISEEKFKQLWKEYENDPVKDMRQMLGSGNVKLKLNVNGKEMEDSGQILREMEAMQKEAIKSDNNKLEPALYK